MKFLINLLENDEFKSQEITLDHLFKVQKAASHHVCIYLTQLKKKYPEVFVPWWSSHSSNLSYRYSSSWPSWESTISPVALLTDQEKAKYISRFENMIKAKKAYEKAGGIYYEKKLKESDEEFESQPLDLNHLDKVQKAASHQFYVYLTQLKKKYPEMYFPSSSAEPWLSHLSTISSKLLPTTSYLISSPSWITTRRPISLTDEEKAKYRLKYKNMFKAKKAYEKAGGIYYEEELKESDDEFESQDITINHLNKAQKAACYQLYVYVMQLKKKYPEIYVPWVTPSYLSTISSMVFPTRWLMSMSPSQLTDQEKTKFQSKFDNIVKAKKAYEKAGGIYNDV